MSTYHLLMGLFCVFFFFGDVYTGTFIANIVIKRKGWTSSRMEVRFFL